MDKRLLTHSSMTCAKTCLRMYYFRYVVGLVKQRESTPLRVGSLVHEGLDKRKTPEYQEYPPWCMEDEEKYKWDCDQALARAMVDAYLEYWKDDVIETIMSEQSFFLPIRNPETQGMSRNCSAAGRIDKIVSVPAGILDSFPNGCKALLEHKTTSDDLEPDSLYWRRLKMDQQISHYFNAAVKLGLEVETSVYDVIRRPALRPKTIPVLDEDGLKIVNDDQNGARVMTKDGKPRQSAGSGMTLKTRREEPVEFEDRVRNAMLEDPDRYFCRRDIPRMQSDLDEFEQELWQQQKMISECYNHGYWFRNTSACMKYNAPCEYFDVCCNDLDVEDVPPLGFEHKKPHSELE